MLFLYAAVLACVLVAEAGSEEPQNYIERSNMSVYVGEPEIKKVDMESVTKKRIVTDNTHFVV